MQHHALRGFAVDIPAGSIGLLAVAPSPSR